MSVTALTFPAFVDTTSSEQLWQIFSALQGQVVPSGSTAPSGAIPVQPPVGVLTFSGGTVSSTSPTPLGVTPTKTLTIQNTSTGSAVLFVSTTNAALTNVNSINIGPGVGYQFPYIPTGTIYIGASASCTYSFWYA